MMERSTNVFIINHHLAGEFSLLGTGCFCIAMTGSHLSVNQHAIHHVHARYMSNLVIGPGGQATLVAPDQSQFTLAISSSSTAANSATVTQQGVSFASSVVTNDMATNTLSFTPAVASTTVVVTTEVFETSFSPSSSSSPTSSTIFSSSTSTPSSILSSSLSSSDVQFPTSTVSGSSSESVSPSKTNLAASSTSSAMSVTQEPTFYVGIVLGTIVVIACFAAFVAWSFRMRTHNRRRKNFVAVPWAYRPESSLSSFTDPDSLEKGESLSPHWEPRGDRDAGEPKRTKSYLETLSSPVKRRTGPILGLPSPPPVIYPFHPHPTVHQLPSYPSSLTSVSPSTVGPLQESVAYPLPNSSRPLPPQPSYLQLNTDLHSDPPSVHMQFLTDPEFGTPRMEMLKPRYLGLDKQGLSVPWKTQVPTLAPTSKEVSSLSVPITSETLVNSPVSLSQRISEETVPIIKCPSPPLASAPQTQTRTQNETWSSSLKANLVYAFNAVAKVAGGSHADEEYDKLSPLPSRNASRNRRSTTSRASVHQTEWVEYFGGELVGKAPSQSQVELEETSDGRGIVHIQSFSEDGLLPLPGTVGTGLGLGLESYRGNDHAFSPVLSSATCPSAAPSRKSSVASYASTAALVVKKKNPSVRSTETMPSVDGTRKMAGSQRRPKFAYDGEMAGASRRGSVASRAPRLPSLPPFSRSGSSETMTLSRMSTMRSMISTRSVITVLSDREELARKALIERRRRGTAAGVFDT